MIDPRVDLARRWRKYRIPVRYQGLRLTDSQMTPANRAALLLARRFADSYTERYAPLASGERPELLGRGVLLTGNPGTGKTRIACGAATEAHIASNTSVLYLPVTNYFALGREQQKFTTLAEKLKDPDAISRVWDLQQLIDSVVRVPLLVFDDMGKEYSASSGWVATEVHRILRTRFDKGRPSFLTSNLPIEEWKKYDGAMHSFLQEACDIVNLGGEDWRRAGQRPIQ